MDLPPIVPGKTRCGFVGTGVMGRHMCHRLMAQGVLPMTVYNRTSAKCEPLREMGASVAASPKAVAEASDVVFVIVGLPKDVEQVILGEEGVLAGLPPGGIVVDMTTSEPALAERMAGLAAEKGCHAVDAPVSGGDVGAEKGTLSIMVGGKEKVVAAIQPLLECMGKNIRHMGAAGCGQHTKMANQILIASNMVGTVEALLYAQRAGLGVDAVIAAVGAGAAGSWTVNNLGPRIARRDFDPGFFVEHFIKDMGIALNEAARMGLALPGLALAHQLYLAVRAQGHGRLGTQALMLALEKLNAVGEPPQPHTGRPAA